MDPNKSMAERDVFRQLHHKRIKFNYSLSQFHQLN